MNKKLLSNSWEEYLIVLLWIVFIGMLTQNTAVAGTIVYIQKKPLLAINITNKSIISDSLRKLKAEEFGGITVKDGDVYYYIKGLNKSFNVLFLADTHFTVEDERGRDFYNYTKRMGGAAVEPENYGISNKREKALIASLDRAKEAGSELVILGGDVLNFPSLASVDSLKSLLDTSGLNWTYIAGNHDWHYEGETGDSYSLREKWVHSNLEPLYQGANPMYNSQIIHSINFVTIDNSIFEITNEQIAFLQNQIKKGLPIILSMHIPIYLEGHNHNIDYGCGHPNWNNGNDSYYKIERREPWPEDGFTETTYQFRDLIINSSEIIGVFAGHTHKEAVDYFNNKIQYVSAANYNNNDILIHFLPVD